MAPTGTVPVWMARLLKPGAALLLALCMLAPSAWDRNRMLATAQSRGPKAVAAARGLQATILAMQGRPEPAQLDQINTYVNGQIVYTDDIITTGEIDHWDSPLEVLARGAGDCEDYAIAKYFSLIAAGMPSVKLRLVYVRAERGGTVAAHMVLAYYQQPSADPLILDSLMPEIRPASQRRDLTPVFSFNAEGLWRGTAGERAGDPAVRLSRWRDVLNKARVEGFP